MSEEPDRQVVFLNVTTTQRDSLTAQTGGVVFNTTTNKLQCYDGSTWNDLSGNGNNGTISGSTYNSNFGGNFVFDGSNDSIIMDTATNLGINNTSSSFSYSVWFKTSAANEKYMFDNYDGSTQNVSFRLDGRRLELYLRGSSGGIINSVRYGYYTLNVWNNAVYTYNGSTGTFIAYLNGINTGSSTSSFTGNFESGSTFRIGTRPSGGGWFEGEIASALLLSFFLDNLLEILGNISITLVLLASFSELIKLKCFFHFAGLT